MQAMAGTMWALGAANKAPAGNGLLNNLVAFWGLDEAGGANNALDKHSNGLTLTQANSPGSSTGKVYAGARTFVAASKQGFTRNSETLLQGGDNDVTWAAWVNLSAKPTLAPIIAKYDLPTDAGREYIVNYSNAIRRFRIGVNSGVAGSEVSAVANTFGEPALSTWYLIIGWHDAVANTVNISIDNGATDSTPFSGGMAASTETFAIGKIADGTYFWSGSIGPVAMWKSTAGNGGVLTAAQRTALYNAGAGLAYEAFTA